MKFKNATIYAYDIDKNALKLCASLAIHNEVSNQIILRENCTSDTLNEMNFDGRTLIICDCEGYERMLFNESNFCSFKNTDLIIELHPFYSADVKEHLVSLFKLSHHCTIVSSLDRDRKITDFKFSLQGLNKMEQVKSVEEGRPYTMDWLIAESNIYK